MSDVGNLPIKPGQAAIEPLTRDSTLRLNQRGVNGESRVK
jgi:hypothetical protein